MFSLCKNVLERWIIGQLQVVEAMETMLVAMEPVGVGIEPHGDYMNMKSEKFWL